VSNCSRLFESAGLGSNTPSELIWPIPCESPAIQSRRLQVKRGHGGRPAQSSPEEKSRDFGCCSMCSRLQRPSLADLTSIGTRSCFPPCFSSSAALGKCFRGDGGWVEMFRRTFQVDNSGATQVARRRGATPHHQLAILALRELRRFFLLFLRFGQAKVARRFFCLGSQFGNLESACLIVASKAQ